MRPPGRPKAESFARSAKAIAMRPPGRPKAESFARGEVAG
jgi:hypothetical protein